MPSVEDSIHDLVFEDAGVQSMVPKSTSVAPLRMLKSARELKRPYITYAITESPIQTAGGADEWSTGEVDFGVFCDTYNDCIDLSAELKRLVGCYSGTQSGVQFAPLFIDPENGITDVEPVADTGKDRPIYFRRILCRMMFKIV